MRCGALVVFAWLASGCGRVGFDPRIAPNGDGDITGDVAPPSAGLVAWYKLDETSGTTVADSSGTGADAWTDSCGSPFPSWTPGRFGNALDLVASATNCVHTNETAALQLAGSWTISAWIRLSSIPNAGQAYAVVIKPNGFSQHNYALFVDNGWMSSGTGWAVDFHDVGSTMHVAKLATSLAVGAWVHLAGTWDGGTLTLYVDGAAAATNVPGAVPYATPYMGGAMAVIGHNQCCAEYLDGTIDDVRIYNRALVASEIAALHTAP